jgi:hypothetical protein
MNNTIKILTILMLTMAVGMSADAEKINGFVKDSDTGLAIATMAVNCSNSTFSNTTTTSATGQYNLSGFKNGTYNCAFQKYNYPKKWVSLTNEAVVENAKTLNMSIEPAYYTQYSASDVPSATFDLGGTIIVSLIGLAGIVAVVMVYNASKGKKIVPK